jgi:hypothetical protein
MKLNKTTKDAIQMIASSNNITGHHISMQEDLDIEYVNKEPEEDDIVIMGKNNTIFLEDFQKATIVGNTIRISNYILHIK